MTQTDTQPPDSAAVQTLADAVEADGLPRVFDGADALVRSAIKAKRLRLAPEVVLDDYVLDVVKDALADAYEKAEDFEPERGVTPWLIGFAGYVVQRRIRDRARQIERDQDPTRFDVRLVGDEVEIDGQPDAADDDLFAVLEAHDPGDALDARLDVERALTALEGSSGDGAPDLTSAEHAEILRCYYLDDEDAADLALAYGISENAVHKRLSRARTAAREALGLG